MPYVRVPTFGDSTGGTQPIAPPVIGVSIPGWVLWGAALVWLAPKMLGAYLSAKR